ncbi:STOREKEEPER protein-like [Cornus florida]|uniref:STOREKEEPER protein-like n=1 Tax=Cornus florida TaxID=4283 RepID=UPI00289D4A30|nr:STOREKEEPER protein-like [Cornus florida]
MLYKLPLLLHHLKNKIMNSNTNNQQQTDEQMNNTTDQQKEEKNTVTTNRDEEEDDDDDEKVEETNAEEEKINTNSKNEDAEEENDESESVAGGQEQEDVGDDEGEDDEGEDESVSDKAEEEEDEEKVGNSPLPVDQTVQKSNSTSSEEDSHSESESEYKPLPKPAVKRPAGTSERNEDAEEENDESESEAGAQEQEDDEGEDESVSDKAEEEEEDDEDEGKVGNSPLPAVDKTVQKSNSTSSEEDSHSESESESECKSDCRSSKPLPKPAVKRPAETSEQNDIPERQRKKRKVDNGSQAMEEKKSVFSRFWREEDEIALLMGMIQYKSSDGGDAYTDMGAFYEYIKNYLHVVPLRKQLTDKMGRLKKKYSKNAGKGRNPFFSKPHERKIFELSKKIWGGVEVAAASGGVKASGENFLSMYPRLNESLQWANHALSESGRKLLEEGMTLIGSAKAKKMEEKWRNLQIHEMELYLKHVDLIHQQTKLVLDAMKSGNC